jgi:hypothetical protein
MNIRLFEAVYCIENFLSNVSFLCTLIIGFFLLFPSLKSENFFLPYLIPFNFQVLAFDRGHSLHI